MLVKPVFKLAMKACPYRKDFFEKLGADQTKVAEQLQKWLEALEGIVKIIMDFLHLETMVRVYRLYTFFTDFLCCFHQFV